MSAFDLSLIQNILQSAFQKAIPFSNLKFLSGGCINNAARVETGKGIFFIKWNRTDLAGMFTTEAKGLEILTKAGVIRVPQVHAVGYNHECSYLILEFVGSLPPAKNFWKNFGIALAMQHRYTKPNYGLDFNNYIGSLPQQNEFDDDWISFFIQKRLEVQLKTGFDKGTIDRSLLVDFHNLFKNLPGILHVEKPALLHGDLWSGNVLTAEQVCLIDPAIYYGHREIEISYTRLFGGFDQDFYHSYQEIFPIENGFHERSEIYNLYPLLVHVNLFGGGYLNQVKQTLRKFR